MSKTITELEAEHVAARKARDAVQSRRTALSDVIRALDALDALRSNPALLPSDVAEIAKMNGAGAWLALVEARRPLRAEVDHLDEVVDRAAIALNDAPEEAA